MGKETITTVYDQASMPHWQTGGFGWGTYVAESLFDPEGRPLAMDLGNTYGAVVTYAWEEGTGRLSTLALDRERVNGTEIQLSYRHDEAGNIQSVIDEPSNAAVIGNVDAQCYQYDQLRRLTTAWTPSEADCSTAPTSWSQIGGPAPGWTDYTYDAIGNRTSKTTRSASGSVVTTSTFGSSTTGPHRLLSQTTTGQAATTFTWDAAGNRTSRTQGATTMTYTWDAEGELSGTTSGTAAVNSVYGADGARLVKIDGANATVYLPGGMEITSSSPAGLSATRWYTFAGQTVAHRTGNGLSGVTSIVTDHQGSIIGTIHNTDWAAGVTRHRPDPFGGGRGTEAVTSQGRGFLGEVHDSNALVLLNARYLDPSTGAFISVDPLLDPLDPSHLNAYAYAKNSPITWSDRSGLIGTRYLPDGGGGKRQTGGSNGGGASSSKSSNGDSSAGTKGSESGADTYTHPDETAEYKRAQEEYVERRHGLEMWIEGFVLTVFGVNAAKSSVRKPAPAQAPKPAPVVRGIPAESVDVIKSIQSSGVISQSGIKGGPVPREFANDGRNGSAVLPHHDPLQVPITYREWGTVPHAGNPKPGGERIVTGSDGSIYYSPDHYKSFIKWEP